MNAMNRRRLIGAGLLAACLLSPASRASDEHAAHHAKPAASAAAAEWTAGEVRKIDRDTARLTLRHAEIKSLDMPPMTMVFQVRDKAMLDTLQVGSRLQFRVQSDGGKLVITELKPQP